MIRSVLRGWPWILGATLVAAVVVAISWVSTPQLFRTTVELRIVPPGDPQLWDGPKALERAIVAEGQRMIAMVMGGEVKEAVAQSESIAEQFGLDLTTGKWQQTWSLVWNQRVMVARERLWKVRGGIEALLRRRSVSGWMLEIIIYRDDHFVLSKPDTA